MPMESPDDHAMGNTDKNYCRHCSRPDGSMQSFEEKLDSLTQFVIKTQGLDEKSARELVKTRMSQLPAWKDML
jgi:hypothetical protein